MANVSHASLTGAQLHEPKGVAAAASGEVYVANGAGSGAWTNIASSSFTGMIADFSTPVPPTGWLECDGSVINTTTYAALFNAMTIQQNGSRTNGSGIITGISNTVNMRPGYSIFGTGIPASATIASVDGPNQVTISPVATSTGTSPIIVSPWALGAGTITLPNVYSGGRYRRSRSGTIHIGNQQAGQNADHNHGVSGNTQANNVGHTHTYGGTTGDQSVTHSHTYNPSNASTVSGVTAGGGIALNINNTTASSGDASNGHTHTYGGTSSGESSNHSHPISLTSGNSGGTEARPITLVVITCVKT